MQLRFDEYLTRRSRGKTNFLLEKNNTYVSALMIDLFGKFPSYSFDTADMEFRNINNCDTVKYANKKSFLTVNDLTAFRRSVSLSDSKPEFFADYKNLFGEYLRSTAEWKFLCGRLKDYVRENDLLAEFDKKSVQANPVSYSWFVPFRCQKAVLKIINALISESIIEKASKVTGISAGICQVEINDKYGYKDKYDVIFRNLRDLFLNDDITVETDRIHHVVRVWRNDLYVKNFDCGSLQKTTVKLLRYFADNGYLIDFDYDTNRKRANFIFSSYPLKDLLTSEGRILEIFTYHKAKETGFFNDVRSSYVVDWEGGIASILFSAISLGLTANIKEKIMFGIGILYSVFCIVSALVFLICGFFE